MMKITEKEYKKINNDRLNLAKKCKEKDQVIVQLLDFLLDAVHEGTGSFYEEDKRTWILGSQLRFTVKPFTRTQKALDILVEFGVVELVKRTDTYYIYNTVKPKKEK